VTQFVDECRREWRRLRVPDDIANEMAADLEADLRDAEADGLSPEDVLGNGVFDPRSFAASWASERGVIPPHAAAPSRDRRTLVAAVVGALAIAALAAGIAILSTQHGATRIALPQRFELRPALGAFRFPRLRPGATPRLWVRPLRPVMLPHRQVLVTRGGVDRAPAGWILLGLGLAGMAASLVVWTRVPFRRRYA
jgi:hypothetical protein